MKFGRVSKARRPLNSNKKIFAREKPRKDAKILFSSLFFSKISRLFAGE